MNLKSTIQPSKGDLWIHFTFQVQKSDTLQDYGNLTVHLQSMSRVEVRISAVQTFCSLVSYWQIPVKRKIMLTGKC